MGQSDDFDAFDKNISVKVMTLMHFTKKQIGQSDDFDEFDKDISVKGKILLMHMTTLYETICHSDHVEFITELGTHHRNIATTRQRDNVTTRQRLCDRQTNEKL